MMDQANFIAALKVFLDTNLPDMDGFVLSVKTGQECAFFSDLRTPAALVLLTEMSMHVAADLAGVGNGRRIEGTAMELPQ